MSPQKALETIGANLQKQYENWQPRVSVSQTALVTHCYTLLHTVTHRLKHPLNRADLVYFLGSFSHPPGLSVNLADVRHLLWLPVKKCETHYSSSVSKISLWSDDIFSIIQLCLKPAFGVHRFIINLPAFL